MLDDGSANFPIYFQKKKHLKYIIWLLLLFNYLLYTELELKYFK